MEFAELEVCNTSRPIVQPHACLSTLMRQHDRLYKRPLLQLHTCKPSALSFLPNSQDCRLASMHYTKFGNNTNRDGNSVT